MTSKNIFYHCLVFAFVILTKAAYTFITNDTLVFILKPLSRIISTVTNADFTYYEATGFYFETLNITIDKSCSGINFWCISFLVFMMLLLKICKSHSQKLVLFPLVALVTYGLTLFANSSRIITSIFIATQTDFNYSWLHQAEGIFIYLSFLMLSYVLVNRSLSKFNSSHEKLT